MRFGAVFWGSRMSQSTINWKQGFQLQGYHIEKQNIRVLLIGDSVIAGTKFIQCFHRHIHIKEAGGEKKFEIVKQITTEAMGWKFLLFLTDELSIDVDFIFIFLHAAETIAKPSEFRHVYALFSYLHAYASDGKMPHVVIFRTPTGSSYGEFKRELCQLEARVHQELGASLVEIYSPQTDLREDETHYTQEGILNLSKSISELCDQLQRVQVFNEAGDLKGFLSNSLKLNVLRKKTARSGSSEDICRLILEPSFRDVEYLFPHESIQVTGVGKEVLCLCFIGPYSGVIAVRTVSDSHAITLSDSWCTVSRPYVVSLCCSEESVEHLLEITLTDKIPKVQKYTLSERFDHEPLIDQSKKSFEFEISNYRYAGPTLFPFVAFCIIDY